MAMEENEEIKKTVEVLDELSMSDEERALYEYREKAELDYISSMAYATKRGKLEVAKKMLKKGITIDTIIEITELSEEEILKLQ